MMEVYQAENARAKNGDPQKQGDPLTTFEACKQNARWMIILGTISTGPRYYHGGLVLAQKT